MDIEKLRADAKKATLKLVVACMAAGVLLGVPIGLVIADQTIERTTIVYPDCSGVEV